jgi:hypothetical protein
MGLGRRKPKRTLTGLSIDTTDIACFFSLRRLPSYTGNCIRVVRDSDSTTLDVGFSGDSLDVTAITSFCSGTVGRIIRWYNQVDGSFFDQATQTNQPIIYQSAAVTVENGLPTLLMDLNDRIFSATQILFRSLFAVAKMTSLRGENTLVTSSNFSVFLGGSATGRNGLGCFVSGSVRVSNTTENFNQNQQTIIFRTNDIDVWTNGSDYATASYTVANPSFTSIGLTSSNLGIAGNLQEIIGYTTDKNAQRVAIEAEQKLYYGI